MTDDRWSRVVDRCPRGIVRCSLVRRGGWLMGGCNTLLACSCTKSLPKQTLHSVPPRRTIGQRSSVNEPRPSAAVDQRPSTIDHRSSVIGHRTTDNGQRSTNNGQRPPTPVHPTNCPVRRGCFLLLCVSRCRIPPFYRPGG